MPGKFYPLAVGVSQLLTALAAPALTRHGEKFVAAVKLARQPRWLRGWVWFYSRGLERAARRRRESRLWQLCGRRFVCKLAWRHWS